MEPYIYENIVVGFPALEDDYEPVTERISYLAETLRPAHKEELYAFAETISGGIHGYEQDETISYEEALTFNLIPEALRGTACSALSLWGSKTESGDNVSIRFLDWALGSENQMCMGHAVIHANKGERSYTAISFLGFVSVVSAVNNDGVFGAILDVGSGNEPYSYKDKKCYTYDLKYALEEYDTAEKVGNFMVQNSADYTWSHHIYVTDKDHAYCAEDATGALQKSGKGYSILRDCNTPLIDGLKWDSKDSLCVVNSFASQGNQDFFCGGTDNIVRFKKYNEWVSSKDHFSIGEMKSMLTREKVNQGQYENEAYVVNFRNRGTVQIILVDYHTGQVQVSFTGTDGPSDDVIFTDIGHY